MWIHGGHIFCSPQVTGRDILRLFHSGKNLSTFSRDACTVKKILIWTSHTIIIHMYIETNTSKDNSRPEQSLRCVSSKDVKIVLKLLKSILLIFWLRHYDKCAFHRKCISKNCQQNSTRLFCQIGNVLLLCNSFPLLTPKSLG